MQHQLRVAFCDLASGLKGPPLQVAMFAGGRQFILLMKAHLSKMDCEHSTSPDSSKRRQSSAQAVPGADDPVQAALTAVNSVIFACSTWSALQPYAAEPCWQQQTLQMATGTTVNAGSHLHLHMLQCLVTSAEQAAHVDFGNLAVEEASIKAIPSTDGEHTDGVNPWHGCKGHDAKPAAHVTNWYFIPIRRDRRARQAVSDTPCKFAGIQIRAFLLIVLLDLALERSVERLVAVTGLKPWRGGGGFRLWHRRVDHARPGPHYHRVEGVQKAAMCLHMHACML